MVDKPIPDKRKAIEQACELRLAGWSIAEIASHLGVKAGWVANHVPSVLRREPMTTAEVKTYRKSLAPDTRTWGQRFLGDPVPGRSALDQMRGLD